MLTDVRRGDIWWALVETTHPKSKVIRGFRPVLVVSGDQTNEKNVLITIAPMTTKICHADGQLRVPMLPDSHNCLDKPSLVLADQIMTVDRCTLHHWNGVASDEDMTRVETAIRAALGL